jgi:hypothetical protein
MSPNIIKVIKSRRMRWMGYVVYMGEIKNASKNGGCKTLKEETGRPRHR